MKIKLISRHPYESQSLSGLKYRAWYIPGFLGSGHKPGIYHMAVTDIFLVHFGSLSGPGPSGGRVGEVMIDAVQLPGFRSEFVFM